MQGSYFSRLSKIFWGMALSSVGIVLTLQANIGLEAWSVLQQGLAQTIGITYGRASALVGFAVVLIGVLCGERIGLGTVLNIGLCAMMIDWILPLNIIPQMNSLLSGILMLVVGLELLALGTWLYMLSQMGSGPRDSLMVALAKKTGRSVGVCRISVELLVIIAGWALGGQVGLGTLIAAVGLGSLFNINFHFLHFYPAQMEQEDLFETFRALKKWWTKKKF